MVAPLAGVELDPVPPLEAIACVVVLPSVPPPPVKVWP
jgi:hypothetical protein